MSSARQHKPQARAVHAGLAALVLFAPGPAIAGDDTDTFTVTANVLATCEITANDLDFGDYNPVAATNLDASTTLSLTCTNGTPYQVSLDLGDGAGASAAQRYMVNGGDSLGYTLYRNAGRTLVWGETLGADTLAGTGTGSAAAIDIFGRVPMQQAAPAGAYSDTITVTVTW